MQDDFVNLYAFNRWANDLMLAAARKLTPEQYVAEPVPGWKSIQSTIAHIAIVTEGWMRGVAGDPVDSFPSEEELPTVDAAAAHLEKAYATFARILPDLTPERLATPYSFAARGRSATVAPWVVLRHIVNHSTYHRGQVASKLRRFDVDPPATDLIFWALAQPKNA